MIAADTSRSKAYLQSLVRNNMYPSLVLLLDNFDDKLLPGQLSLRDSRPQSPQGLNRNSFDNDLWSEACFNPETPLIDTLVSARIPHRLLPSKDLNDPLVVSQISELEETVIIFSGYGGVLLREPILSTGKRFLHIHGGYLPNYKGSTTNYFSLIEDGEMGASAIFLVEEIDSGPVLCRMKFPTPPDKTKIDHIYDSAARAKVLLEVLNRYANNKRWEIELEQNIDGESYYIIHPVLKYIATR